MATGIIKNFNAERGFGFIAPDLGGKDLFVHAKNCAGRVALKMGDRVSFDERPDPRRDGKSEAFDVAILDEQK